MMRALFLLVSFLILLPAAGAADEVCVGEYCYDADDSGSFYQSYLFSTTSNAFDIVMIGDGYTEAEMDKFIASATVMADSFITINPYAAESCAFRIWIVRLISEDSGIEVEGSSTWGNQDTALDAVFGDGMNITVDFDKVWKAVDSSAVPGSDFVCVLVNDPSGNDGAWAYQSERVCLVTGAWPWGVTMAHELGHLIANLGDEYQCVQCDQSAGFLTTADWTRTYSEATVAAADQIDNPNLATDIGVLGWQAEINPNQILPSHALNVCSGTTVGAWEGGGKYRYGVWRSEEYCIMDGWQCPSEDHFCYACSSALAAAILPCATAFPDCAYIPFKAPRLLRARSLPPELRIPFAEDTHIEIDIPPCWTCIPDSTDVPGPPLPETYGVGIVIQNLPEGTRVAVYTSMLDLVAEQVASANGSVEITFEADTLKRYFLTLDIPAGNEGMLVNTMLSINGAQVDL